MSIKLIDEYNENGHLIYAEELTGAFVRGRTLDEALAKLPREIDSYCRWLGIPTAAGEPEIIQQKYSELQICDADSDVIFEIERQPMTDSTYLQLRALALRSAADFETLCRSVPDDMRELFPPRTTFYGMVPATAKEIYLHTKSVNSYYFGEIGIDADNEPDIYSCRLAAFKTAELNSDYLQNRVFIGNGEEEWSLRKVCRRFVWHDRIHARALYRRAVSVFGEERIANPFCFGWSEQ